MPAAAREASGALKENLRRRMGAWARRRQGDDRLPIIISTRRVYILPTRAGLAFAALVFVMLLAGLNYANSVALLITFLLAGFGMIAMHLTHRNLVGVALRAVAGVDAFVGEHGRLLVTLENSADTARLGLECEVAGRRARGRGCAGRRHGARRCRLSLERRGRLAVDRITLSTSISVRPVPRLDLRAPARPACSPGRCRAAVARRRPRPRVAAMRRPCIASAMKNGRACANSAAAIRRARWPGARMRAAAACW